MGALFEVKECDKEYYNKNLKNFLPDRIIDFHTHVWLDKHKSKVINTPVRSVTWPRRVAKDNPIEDLMETYSLMFPGKIVTPVIFSSSTRDDDLDLMNSYIKESANKYNLPALLYAAPWWSSEELEKKITEGNFFGIKVYLNLAEPYIPANEIRIFDFLPPHHLEVINKKGLIVMLHIPRKDRLKDPVNLAQLLEIEKKYPYIKLVVAHVGRVYCMEDLGDAFAILSETKNMMFDISANCNSHVFTELIKAVGAKRILFGSDLPILRMRTRRICEEGQYINLVPKGMYGDVSTDKNMREVEREEADSFTFFMYEEIGAFRKAAEAVALNSSEINDVFYRNAYNLLQSVGFTVG